MPKFRKKPVVIEAVQFTGSNFFECARFLGHGDLTHVAELHSTDCPVIETLEGRMTASPGDWIIRGVKGEFYPCKPDIFAATYETASSAAQVEKVFYFGAWSGNRLGHYLYGRGGTNSRAVEDQVPFDYKRLDSGFIPHRREDAKTQDGKVHRSAVNGWSVLAFWHQSGDSRPGSNSALVFTPHSADVPTEELIRLAAEWFPEVFSRPGFPLAAGG